MEGSSTPHNACVRRLLILLFFSKVHSLSKSTLGCYIIATTASFVSTYAPFKVADQGRTQKGVRFGIPHGNY